VTVTYTKDHNLACETCLMIKLKEGTCGI